MKKVNISAIILVLLTFVLVWLLLGKYNRLQMMKMTKEQKTEYQQNLVLSYKIGFLDGVFYMTKEMAQKHHIDYNLTHKNMIIKTKEFCRHGGIDTSMAHIGDHK